MQLMVTSLEYVNYTFTMVYVVEAALKVSCASVMFGRKHLLWLLIHYTLASHMMHADDTFTQVAVDYQPYAQGAICLSKRMLPVQPVLR